ncbi:MAG: hypothetical protein ACRDHE_09410 [Ktedonobacterales bacterium]
MPTTADFTSWQPWPRFADTLVRPDDRPRSRPPALAERAVSGLDI